MMDPVGWHLYIDQPDLFVAADGGLNVSGWCFNETASTAPEIQLVIGDSTFKCLSGLARPDVGATYPSYAAAAVSGFSFSGWVVSGYHSLAIQARLPGDDWVSLAVRPFFGETGPLIGRIDFPLEDTFRAGKLTVTGWALHSQEHIGELFVFQGDASARCEYGIPRPDVSKEFPHLPGNSACGFRSQLDSSSSGPIILKARLASGRVVTCFSGKALSLARDDDRGLVEQLDLELADCLEISRSESPAVSIIIPVYDQIDVTLNCLKAIDRNTSGVPCEVIVVDDNSSQHTQACLDRVRGIRMVRHETNVGFLESCNHGASVAIGAYLVFLNNDTEPGPGWLGSMIRIFDQHKDAGLVGAKLIYPDGRLQEAGGIIFSDGSGWNYGRNDNPDKPEYNYLREVDYCSGACIAIPRSIFHQLGGFDPRYAPAYYEDTDLAFAVRAAGYKVYYQPHAVVVHHEGRTSGTSTETGVKRYQVINHEKFCGKWRSVLPEQCEPGEKSLVAAKDRSAQKRVLVVDARVLCPDQDSGSLRMFNLLTIFQELGFKVTFVPMNGQFLSPYTERMQEFGIECIYDPFMVSFESFIISRGNEFDLIVVSRATVAEVSLPICLKYCPTVPLIFDTVDLHFLRGQREAELAESKEKHDEAEKMRVFELKAISECDATIVVSAFEKDILAVQVPKARVTVVSNIHRTESNVPPFKGRRDFVFIGGFEHPPNVDAMLWFAAEIMPGILAELRDAKLHIVGSKMPKSIKALASEHIVTHGYVKEIDSFFETCLLSVAPLRYGAGVKGKINQSMSFGVPVVSTSSGAEGMHLRHGVDVLIADEPAEFAKHVVRLAKDEALWTTLSKNGQLNIEEHFSFATGKRNLEALLLDLDILGASVSSASVPGRE